MQDARILSEAKLNKALFLAFTYALSWGSERVLQSISADQYVWCIEGGATEGHRFAFDKAELKYSDPEENAIELLRQWRKAKEWFTSDRAVADRVRWAAL